MKIIHNPPRPHGHSLPDLSGYEMGTIVQCDCGAFFVRASGDWGPRWRPVLSWPFDRKARRIIREWEAA